MGSGNSKVKELHPKTLDDLVENVDVVFTKEEIEEWFRGYQVVVSSGSSKMTMGDFHKVYDSVFDGDAKDFVEHLFRSFDIDNDGFVDFKELIVGLCVSGKGKTESKLKWAFKMYDVDRSAAISRDEMLNMLKAIYKMASTSNENKQTIAKIEKLVDEFFQSADRNKDNQICEAEFIEGVSTMPVILQLLKGDPDSVKTD